MTAHRTLACALLLSVGGAFAQPADPLAAAVQKAIVSNPEVTARFNAFRAAGHEVDAARGAWYPRVDANADVGRTRDRVDQRVPADQSLSRSGVGLSVTQLLWDGLATRNEVGRLDHLRSARYFEFIDTTEQTALEAARAYYDVLRFRSLVQLAEDNYVQHKLSSEQIGNRFRAGVGRGVDVEQANARLALAESNLGIEIANLHDVTARYQRIVGEPPPAQAPAGPDLRQGLPGSTAEAMAQATTSNASVKAAVEGLRAARAQAEGQRSAFHPVVQARARTGDGRNLNGIADQRRDNTVEVLMSWNLYNGGSDAARTRQFADLLTQAADLRDRSCRDVRQVTAIAFNDTVKLTEQLRLLERNVAAIERARDAYRQQFEIGQRSLLDLLNAQNEVYTSRRSYVNADHELRIAYARMQAALNRLTATLGLSRLDAGAALQEDWQAGADGAARCPVVDSVPVVTPTAELDARARALAVSRPAAPLPPAAASAPQRR